LWWEGPEWLQNSASSWPNDFPDVSDVHDGVEVERRSAASSHAACVSKELWSLVNRYSSFDKLLRVTAKLKRPFTVFRCRGERTEFSDELTPHELSDGWKFWIRKVQSAHFSAEISEAVVEEGNSEIKPFIPFAPLRGRRGPGASWRAAAVVPAGIRFKTTSNCAEVLRDKFSFDR